MNRNAKKNCRDFVSCLLLRLVVSSVTIIIIIIHTCHGFSSPITTVTTINTKIKATSATTTKIANTFRTNIFLAASDNENQDECTSTRAFKSSAATITPNHNNNNNMYSAIRRTAISIFAALLILIPSSSPSVCLAMTPDQKLVDDVWREVSRQFIDPTFNGQGEDGWKRQRLKAIEKVAEFGPDEETEVYDVIRGMLNTLNDPYTRFLSPEQFQTLTKTYTNPSSSPAPTSTSGIGVQLIGDNKASLSSNDDGTSKNNNNIGRGKVVVANIIANSPAEKAGILSGDAILFIDGIDMTGATTELVASKCRGETGTLVKVEIERPIVEGSSTSSSSSSSSATKRQTMMVTRLLLPSTSIVEASTAILSASNKNGNTNDSSDRKVGILKINSFTQETEQMVRQELKKIQGQNQQQHEKPVSAIIIDLRGNLGGYMPAGVDVAKLFLPPRAQIISEIDRTGRATIYTNDGVGSDTETQIYVLVDRRSASASEILTAALQDNKRATIVSGESRTFGKGRIQNVQQLSSGSGIAVTRAKYMTPNGRDIQSIGIVPDIRLEQCTAKETAKICMEGIL